jgi:predicted DNA-binding protein (UPF0251 family)
MAGPSENETPLERSATPICSFSTKLLHELDELKREIGALIELEELTMLEAADLLGIPINTAHSHLRAARQTFEAAVSRETAREEALSAGSPPVNSMDGRSAQ